MAHLKIWKALLIGSLALGVLPSAAMAEAQSECTDNAEQSGYNMQLLLHNGKTTDGSKVYRLGLSLIKLCEGRYNAQGLIGPAR